MDRILVDFLAERYRGTRPIAWGRQLQELWLTAGIYCGVLGIGSLVGDGTPAATVPGADVVVVGAGLAGLLRRSRLADAGARVDVVAAATRRPTGPPAASTSRLRRRATRPMRLEAPEGAARSSVCVPRRRRGAGGRLVRGPAGRRGADVRRDLDAPLGRADGDRRRPAAWRSCQRAGCGARPVVAGRAARRRRSRGVQGLLAGGDRGEPRAPEVWGRGDPVRAPARVDAVSVELPGLAGGGTSTRSILARLSTTPAWRGDALAADRAMRWTGRVPVPAGSRCRPSSASPITPAALADADRLAPAASLRGAARPAEHAGDAPVRRAPGRASPTGRQDPGRRGGRPGRACRRTVTADRDRGRGARAPVSDRWPRPRDRRDRRRRARRQGRGDLGRAAPRPARRGPDDRRVARARSVRSSRPPARVGGHPDRRALRPVDANGHVAYENVAVVGSLLAGQRYLVERCGDGVAIASGRRAASTFGAAPAQPSRRREKAGAAR